MYLSTISARSIAGQGDVSRIKKKTYRIGNFTVPAHHRVKLKETERRDKYLDLAGVLNTPRNMKVTMIPTVIGAFGTVTNVLIQGLEDLEITERLEAIQTTALLRSVKILRRVLET